MYYLMLYVWEPPYGRTPALWRTITSGTPEECAETLNHEFPDLIPLTRVVDAEERLRLL
jgi:hypothetical protein